MTSRNVPDAVLASIVQIHAITPSLPAVRVAPDTIGCNTSLLAPLALLIIELSSHTAWALVLMLKEAVPPGKTRSDRLSTVTPVLLGAVVGGTLSPAAPITTGARRVGDRGRSVGG